MERSIASKLNNKPQVADGSKKKNTYVPIIIIAVLTLLPMTTFGNLVRLGVAAMLFLFKDRTDMKISIRVVTMFLAMLGGIALSSITVHFVEGGANFSATIHEAQRFVFYILLILVVYDCKVPFKLVYWLCIGILLINFTIQMLQFNDVEWINDFLRDYYVTGNTIHLDLATTKYGTGSFRSGSLYLNPNVYMVIPSVVLAVVLQANMLKHSLLNYLWAVIALWSLLFTGSRTTFFVALGLVVVYLILDKNIGVIKWFVLAIAVVVLLFNMSALQENYRVFAVSEGLDASLGVKFGGLIAYLQNANPIYYITGSLSSSLFVHIDSEWGYIFAYFGIIGYYWYINFIMMLGRNKKALPFLSVALIIIICLIGISATLVLCMPVFSFFCLVGLVELEV